MTSTLRTPPLAMTRGRRVTLAIGLPIALAVIGWTGLTLATYFGRGSYTLQENIPAHGSRLSVGFGEGQLTLRPATGGLVSLSGTTHYSLVRPDVKVRSTPEGISISGGCLVPTGAGCAFNYRIAVPAGLAVSAESGSGDVVATGFTHGAVLSADSGEVRVSDVGGDLRLSDNEGDITGTGLTGPDVVATADSGEISLTFTRVPQSVVITNNSGDVSVVLPRGSAAYRVRAYTNSGTSTVSVPNDPSSSHVIRVTVNSGDISITEAR